ncbi:hypothetical protein K438DRAFT_133650 [Mycena galopus ATCC 62051]|nr:hypothetical protein K438DRAFT_133650 [Mycena galopus ATCC 62051]
MTWQASGILEKGCTLSTITIKDAYHISLTADPTQQLDTRHLDSPRQRNEFHFPQVGPETAFAYTWKQYLYPSTGTGDDTWFHLMQAFGVEERGPLVTLDAEGGMLRVKDYVRGLARARRRIWRIIGGGRRRTVSRTPSPLFFFYSRKF